jgi:hypothetical protein
MKTFKELFESIPNGVHDDAPFLTPRIFYHITPTKNVDSILKNGLEPRIGYLSNEFGESEPKIYLFKDKEGVEEGWSNWMETYFDEEEPMTVLKITLPPFGIKIENGKHEFEYTTKQKIDPAFISTNSGIEI